jgi:hypothetical protein
MEASFYIDFTVISSYIVSFIHLIIILIVIFLSLPVLVAIIPNLNIFTDKQDTDR